MPSDAVRKWTHAFSKAPIICFVTVLQAVPGFCAHTRNFISIFFQALDSPRQKKNKKMCRQRCVIEKPLNNSVS